MTVAVAEPSVASEKSGPSAWRLIICGLSVALSVIAIVALRTPSVEGWKLALILQVAPAARLGGQLLTWAKSPLLVPVMAILLIVRGVAAALVTFTVVVRLVPPRGIAANVTVLAERTTSVNADP